MGFATMRADAETKESWLQDIRAVLVELGHAEHSARDMARALFGGLQRLRGGMEHYIPAEDREGRDAAIRAEFNGRNRDDVCRKFGISKSQFYKILSR